MIKGESKMKKLFVSLMIVFAVSASYAQGDATVQRSEVTNLGVAFDFGTVTNGTNEVSYIDLRGWKSVDSIVVSLSASNETDIDSVVFYLGNLGPSGFIVDASAGALHQVSTLDVAAGGTDFLALLTSDATLLTKAALRGVSAIKAVYKANTGNDATDPNKLVAFWRVYGTK